MQNISAFKIVSFKKEQIYKEKTILRSHTTSVYKKNK